MLLDTPLCNFGWPAPDFTLKDPLGVSFKMSDYVTDKGVLIAFICNHCPYVIAIAKRFSEDMATLKAEGFGVLAIMSNDYARYASDNPANMAAFSKTYNFDFPYLVDEDQAVAKAYNAVCTPDFFGLNADGALQYRGRIDDARMGDPTGRKTELLNAMREIGETGKGPTEQFPSMGCSIKWKA